VNRYTLEKSLELSSNPNLPMVLRVDPSQRTLFNTFADFQSEVLKLLDSLLFFRSKN